MPKATSRKLSNATSLKQLAEQCSAFAVALNEDVTALAKDIEKELVFKLVNLTPVDTSKALSNWQVSFSTPNRGVRAAYALGRKGTTASSSRAVAYAVAVSTINQQKPTDTIVWVSNNVSYINLLNMGYSPQAAARFINNIVADVEVEADNRLRKLLNGY